MALRVKKLRFPKELANTEYSISLEQEGVTEDGSPMSAFEDEGKCIFSEKSKRIITEDGSQVTLLGKVAIEGDIAPNLKTVASGNITLNGKTYEIYEGYRPRNPDGSIFCTEFEVM